MLKRIMEAIGKSTTLSLIVATIATVSMIWVMVFMIASFRYADDVAEEVAESAAEDSDSMTREEAAEAAMEDVDGGYPGADWIASSPRPLFE